MFVVTPAGPVEPTKIEVEESASSVQEEGSQGTQERRKSKKKMGTDTSPFAMNNRDPNNINPHIQVI